jgi:hypothetical protein
MQQKKYKLIKLYPGSPELGTIRNWNSNSWSDNNDFTENKMFQPSHYPEFWELVVEKDYEILDTNIDDNLKQTIHSIKRKSDSEIFTIGDKIQYYNITGEKSHTHVISDITIYENKILLNHNHGTWKSHGDFNKVQKAKQPLFTTEDGVDIFAGMSFYYVCQELELYNTICCTDEKKYKNAKQFSTKEKAEEYILLNKPCLSLQDIITLKNKNYKNSRMMGRISPLFFSKIKELVKQRL